RNGIDRTPGSGRLAWRDDLVRESGRGRHHHPRNPACRPTRWEGHAVPASGRGCPAPRFGLTRTANLRVGPSSNFRASGDDNGCSVAEASRLTDRRGSDATRALARPNSRHPVPASPRPESLRRLLYLPPRSKGSGMDRSCRGDPSTADVRARGGCAASRRAVRALRDGASASATAKRGGARRLSGRTDHEETRMTTTQYVPAINAAGGDHRTGKPTVEALAMMERTRGARDLLSSKWKVDLLYLLARGVRRYSRLYDNLRGASKKMLTDSLRSLERDGFV